MLNLNNLGNEKPFFLISGPCSAESWELCDEIASELVPICKDLGIPYIFKASFDKANRSSGSAYRGPGLQKGLQILWDIKQKYNIPVITDIHEESQIRVVSEFVDVLQTPAFLCRQSDFIHAVASSGRPVNIKKGQFLDPAGMQNVLKKAQAALAEKQEVPKNQFWLCERGASFGYNNLVVDFRGFEIMKKSEAPVVFDVTHSVQLPGGQGTSSGGDRSFVPSLALAGIATGLAGLFMECHPTPETAGSDGPNSMYLKDMKPFLIKAKQIDTLVKGWK